jgi:hypothetical protein
MPAERENFRHATMDYCGVRHEPDHSARTYLVRERQGVSRTGKTGVSPKHRPGAKAFFGDPDRRF